jgi:hypothetical protein
MLTYERLRELLDYDPETGAFRWKPTIGNRRSGCIAGSPHSSGYLSITIDGHNYLAHRLAWLFQTGKWPNEMIDHVDCSRNNNRFSNLRQADRSQNMCNRTKSVTNKSGFKGVHWHYAKRRWQAKIGMGGKYKHLGYFSTPEAAHAAYIAAAEAKHLGFARY